MRNCSAKDWWRWEDLNLRQRAYETPALPLSYTAKAMTTTTKSEVIVRSMIDPVKTGYLSLPTALLSVWT